MKFSSEHIDSLITRYLAGEATADEIQQLEAWMDASLENKKYFAGIRFAHDKAVASRPVMQFNAETAWKKVQTQMHANQTGIKNETRVIPFYQKNIFRIAASVLIVVGLSALGYITLNKINDAQPVLVEATNEIQPSSLPDSSKIVVNKKSQITYSKNFGKTNREVALTGEAFFDVKHDTALPFVVKTDVVLIQDVGTSFNVKAYPDSGFIEVHVASGEVLFYTLQNKGISLAPGETGIFDKTTNTFKKIKSAGTQSMEYLNRVFVFNKIKLSEAVTRLNGVYCEQITIDPALANVEITVTFENESLENIVQVIAETLGLNLTKQENGWLISGN